MKIRNLILIAFYILIFIPFPLFASEWEEKTITGISFDSKGDAFDESLRSLIEIKNGDRYQTSVIRQIMSRLYETGKIKSVILNVTPISENKIAIQWMLSAKRMITKIAVSGQRQFSEQEIYNALSFSPNKPFDEDQWKKQVAALDALYKSEGYFNVQIKSDFQTQPEDPFQILIQLNIEEGNRARIESLSFTKDPVFPDLILQLSTVSQKPDYYSTQQISSDMKRLKKLYTQKGYLRAIIGPPSVHFSPQSQTVSVQIPIFASHKIDFLFHGVSTLTGKESLSPFIPINEETTDLDQALEEGARAIKNFYREKGYPFVEVQVKTKGFSSGKNCEQALNERGLCDRIEAHFTIENLIRTKMRQIRFLETKLFSQRRLKKLVQIKEEGLLRKTYYTKERLNEDVENLTLFYKKEGFQSVHVTQEINFDEKKEWADLTFQIQEGVRTRIDSIVLKGAEKLSEKEISKSLLFRQGDPYNKEIAREGARQMLTAYAKHGYADSKIDTEVTFSEDASFAHIQYQIIEGEQIFFGPLKLTGHLKTKDNVLLREMRFKEGDTYDYEKVLLSQQRLNQTGLFSGIRFEPTRNADAKTRSDMNLTVVERSRVATEFGPGYRDSEGVRGFFEITHRNLFGTGRRISGRAEGSRVERRYSLHYKEPHIFSYDTNVIIGTTYFLTQAGTFKPFDEEAFLATVSFEKSLSRLWKTILLYEYKDTTISNVKPGVTLTQQDIGRLFIGSLNPSFIRDTRNDLLNPTHGSVHAITFRNAAQILGSQELATFYKITHQSSGFLSPTPKSTIALSLRIGGSKKFGETSIIPLSERFFSGGRSTVRGYAQNKLGVDGETIVNGIPKGGNAMLILNEELRFLLYGSFGAVFFFDHGNVWREFKEIKMREIKSTVGVGLYWNTPFGPLRMDWGYKLDREKMESASEYHFTLGHGF
ncbi:MAG: outer membrane protein assembly factor BamA [Nitrospirota bacterium]